MDALELLRSQFASLRRDWTAITGDLTSEQVHWRPPGVANPIASLLLHAVDFEDRVVQQTAQGKKAIWDSGNWGQKLKVSPVGRQDLVAGRALRLDLSLVKQYINEVAAATEAYLAVAKPADLDRKVAGFRGETPLVNMFSAVVTHTLEHAGEISALKGCQGGKGYAG